MKLGDLLMVEVGKISLEVHGFLNLEKLILKQYLFQDTRKVILLSTQKQKGLYLQGIHYFLWDVEEYLKAHTNRCLTL